MSPCFCGSGRKWCGKEPPRATPLAAPDWTREVTSARTTRQSSRPCPARTGRATSGLCPARPWQPLSGRVPACPSARTSPCSLALPALVWEEERAVGAQNLSSATLPARAQHGRDRPDCSSSSSRASQGRAEGEVLNLDLRLTRPGRPGSHRRGRRWRSERALEKVISGSAEGGRRRPPAASGSR